MYGMDAVGYFNVLTPAVHSEVRYSISSSCNIQR